MNLWKRVTLETDPFLQFDRSRPYEGSLPWPCRWIACPGAGAPPFVTAYRLHFNLEAPVQVRIHVTADERYVLYLDGEAVGRGPERGDPRNWFYESYDLSMSAGAHILAARSWAFGPAAPLAQMSLRPGFLLCAEDPSCWDLLNTGRANWEALKLESYAFIPPTAAFGAGHRIVFDAQHYPWNFELCKAPGQDFDWQAAQCLHPGYNAASRGHAYPNEHLLRPAVLPAMLEVPRRVGRVRHISAPVAGETNSMPVRAVEHLYEEEGAWSRLIAGQSPLSLPANTRRRIILDLEDYYCAYPEVVVSGGAGGSLRFHWQEGLFTTPGGSDRGSRDEVEGKYFTTIGEKHDSLGDLFFLDGGSQRKLEALWWNAGRYVEILVETQDHPLTIESLEWRETRYPYENESRFTASDPRLELVIPAAVRALQMCSHETYMDCPYYEQLMYIGDARLECLVTYVTNRDARLPRKALQMFAESRLANGLTQSRYPSRERQIIPPFSLWWIGMLHDYLLWRGEADFIEQCLPAARSALDAFIRLTGSDGLVRSPVGWNFIDWVASWETGVPPGGDSGASPSGDADGICAPLNWQVVYALTRLANLEEAFGEQELAARARRLASQTTRALTQFFWDAEQGLFADDLEHLSYSEHSQCLALLADAQSPGLLGSDQRQSMAKQLFTTQGLTQPTVYFLHYFFETCRVLERMDVFIERMQPWFAMPAYGFKTTYENADPHTNRSDCHAWAAHPLYHYFASLLGIRPAAAGFARVEIVPQLGPVEWASGTMPHPAGEISVDFHQADGRISGQIRLPEGIHGVLRANNQWTALLPGLNIVR